MDEKTYLTPELFESLQEAKQQVDQMMLEAEAV